jgi:PAS domain S-box-containing protein
MQSEPSANQAAAGPDRLRPALLAAETRRPSRAGACIDPAPRVGLRTWDDLPPPLSTDSADDALARMRAMFEGALNGILLAYDKGVYVDANPAICRMLGYSRDELVGRSVRDLVAADVDPASLWQRFINDRHQMGRVALRHHDGHLVMVDYMATSHILPDLHLSVLEDASARMQAEAALCAAQDKLKALSVQQQTQFEAFRAEMARDLHDEVGQSLSALQLEADRIADVAPASAERIRELVQQSLSSLRDVARSLRPPALDCGLVPALRALARDTARASDLDVALELPAQAPALAPNVEVAVFRLAQEALNNAIRHACASKLSLCLDQQGGDMVLEICDNGVGFACEQTVHEGGLGLLGMRERALLAGAELQTISARGAGTLVRVRVPLNV